MTGKTPEETKVVMTELVMPEMTNALGNLRGGQMMHWMDIAAGIACMRHARKPVVTVAVEAIEFKHPVHQNALIHIEAKIIWTGKTSMRTKIKATTEDLATGALEVTNIATFTFVSLGEDGNRTEAPPLLPQTEEERQDFDCAEREYRERTGKQNKCI
jgi:acyl-CoA hydrolase